MLVSLEVAGDGSSVAPLYPLARKFMQKSINSFSTFTRPLSAAPVQSHHCFGAALLRSIALIRFQTRTLYTLLAFSKMSIGGAWPQSSKLARKASLPVRSFVHSLARPPTRRLDGI